jgi:hypothetical protein
VVYGIVFLTLMVKYIPFPLHPIFESRYGSLVHVGPRKRLFVCQVNLGLLPGAQVLFGDPWGSGRLRWEHHLPGLVNVYVTMENHHLLMGKSPISTGPFSIAKCYQAG